MGERRRVDGQPCFVLHSFPFRETSLIIDVFSRDFGRIPLMARGARRPRSPMRGLLMAFQPLELGWAGAGEVMTLMKAEWQGGLPLLSQRALFVGYYFNELLMHLLPREDAHPKLFDAYQAALRNLAHAVAEANVRSFEKILLQELGYGLTLENDATGAPLIAEALYSYVAEKGPVRLFGLEGADTAVLGKTLLDLAQDDFSDALSVQQSKQLMRQLVQYHIGDRPLVTRRIYQELQEL